MNDKKLKQLINDQKQLMNPWSPHCQLHILSILSPLVEQQPIYVKDSNHAINILSTFHFQGEHCFLFSMDVKSLYTSIPQEDGLIALRHFLDQRPDPEPPTNTLIRLAELVLQKNFFSFNGSFYVQKSGVTMGSDLGHSFARLFVSYQEEKSFKVIKAPYLNFSNVLLMMV